MIYVDVTSATVFIHFVALIPCISNDDTDELTGVAKARKSGPHSLCIFRPFGIVSAPPASIALND